MVDQPFPSPAGRGSAPGRPLYAWVAVSATRPSQIRLLGPLRDLPEPLRATAGGRRGGELAAGTLDGRPRGALEIPFLHFHACLYHWSGHPGPDRAARAFLEAERAAIRQGMSQRQKETGFQDA